LKICCADASHPRAPQLVKVDVRLPRLALALLLEDGLALPPASLRRALEGVARVPREVQNLAPQRHLKLQRRLGEVANVGGVLEALHPVLAAGA